jgi:hypothetical protein
LKKLLSEILIFIALFLMFTFTMFTAGYTAEKYAPGDDVRCINAACESDCVPNKKFKRHEGCK